VVVYLDGTADHSRSEVLAVDRSQARRMLVEATGISDRHGLLRLGQQVRRLQAPS
jgi:hypothetical protein